MTQSLGNYATDLTQSGTILGRYRASTIFEKLEITLLFGGLHLIIRILTFFA